MVIACVCVCVCVLIWVKRQPSGIMEVLYVSTDVEVDLLSSSSE